jgi:hypothetical protein
MKGKKEGFLVLTLKRREEKRRGGSSYNQESKLSYTYENRCKIYPTLKESP